MKITITPTDIIERCLWDDFEYYVLSKDVNVEEFINNNEEFDIEENDALVIGLLKCVETNNLCHRLNQHIQHFVSNRAFTIEKKYYVKKKLLVDVITKFDKKFPSVWEPRAMYKGALVNVLEYMEQLLESIEGLKITENTDNFGTHELVEINHVKKILKHHH
ncbi:MAG: hypothetical protein SLAVMIC_00802 [uncultured marine phage]|uniref:Uncharacterized protein n=1 Tax=uncultured marine phage TaxID=707152 RepID=A0A8D9CDN8_9VIRU|nr:MAG: hypothetical protein SLAVMIC_00802 [uncultured marine phage]